MEDTFRVRVDKTFNSLPSSSSSSSSQTLTPSLWCLTDEEIEKRQWTREPDASIPIDDDDDEDEDKDNEAFLASNVDKFFFKANDEKSMASENNLIPNPNPNLNELDFRKEVEDDLKELDDNGGEGCSAKSAANECREVVCGEGDELEVKKVIGMDCTLDFEAKRGLGLTAHIIDHCKLKLKYPEGTNSTWYNEQFKKKEPLEYDYDICEAILLWEQYRNVTTVLTREYLDVRPDGWLDYAAKRIAQLGSKKCFNQSLCDELLSPILPATPPFHPRQFEKCAVVGNSGDLLLTEFGEEIDSHDAVIRDNEAPVNEKYAKHVGMKRTFRLGVRGTARNMINILKGAPEEVFIIKSVTHRDFNEMIKSIANPVYLFQGIVLRRGAKGTGMKSVELALSMCDIVDIYGLIN